MAVVKNLMVRAGADFSDFEQKLKKAQAKLQGFGDKMAGIGSKMKTVGLNIGKWLAAGVGVAVVALGALALKAGDAADELLTLSAQTGIATDTLQGLDYAARFVDVELEAMQKAWAKTTKAIGKATKEGSDYIEVADGVSVSIKGASGKLKSSEQVFYDLIDVIGGLKDETMQEVVAQELFGKSYQDLMPLIDGGSAALKKYIAEAKRLGLVISEKDLKALGEFDDAMERIQAQTKSFGMRLAVVMLPAMKQMASYISNTVVPALDKWLEKFKSPAFKNLSFSAKINFIADDIAKTFTKWWNSGGKQKMTAFGKRIGEMLAIGLTQAAPAIGAALVKIMAAAGKAGGKALFDATFEKWVGNAIYKSENPYQTWWSGQRAAQSKEMIDKVITPTGHNAAGTNYWRGGLSWVGERGPELVNLPRGAKVLSNQQSMAMAGQTINHTGTVTHVFQTNDRQTVARIAEEFARDNRRLPSRVATVPIQA